MARTSDRIPVWRLKVLLLVSSVASLVLLGLAAFQENLTGDWRRHQADYRQALVARAATPDARQAAEEMEIALQQIFLPDLRRIDRCVSCHIGVADPAQAGAPLPLGAHSGDILEHHPPERMGCTVCHEGQGRAVERDAAHGEVPHWTQPLLRGEAVYTSCGKCHHTNDPYGSTDDLFARSGPPIPLTTAELDASVPGAGAPDERAIGRGKQLMLESGCLGCHRYRRRGGTLGPEITHVGDKTVHDLDFRHVEGERTVARWLEAHFLRPAEVTPGTLMPEMGLADSQAADLAQYMLSLHRKSMPASLTPVPPLHGDAMPDGERLWGMFCAACHGATGQGRYARDPDLRLYRDEPRELLTPALNNPDTLAVASDDYLRRIITTGRRDTSMLSWAADEGGMLPEEIDRLVTFIRSWEGPGPAPESISAARGNVHRGRVLYRGRCLACHGVNGRGGIGVALSSPSFLAVASDRFLARTILEGRASTAMPRWRQLSAGEVSDILAYIRSWEPEPADRDQVLAALAAPGEVPARSLRMGRAFYRGSCAACHGPDGEGGLGPSLNTDELLSLVGDDYLYEAIVGGRPGTAMPAWKKLSSDDVVDLIRFLRRWNDGDRRELEPFLARGDWDRGQILFEGNCAPCHGHQAEGLSGPQLGNPRFLASVSDAVLREWITYGRTGTAMRAFGRGQQGVTELSDSQIEDIITYLRRFELTRPEAVSRPGSGIVARGAELYAGGCASCHGDRGQGITGSALSNPDFLRWASDGFLEATIVLGRDGTGMRPMGQGGGGVLELSPVDVANIVAFVRSWEREPPIQGIPHRHVTAADPDEGRELFAGNCSGCHGAEGKGGWAPELHNADFLAAATDGFLLATIVRGRAGTPMRPFGPGTGGIADLTGDQISNVVAYIRSWAGTPQADASAEGAATNQTEPDLAEPQGESE